LAVVLLAQLTAILPGHPDRMPPLLGKARVIDDPRFDRPAILDRRQHKLAHPWPASQRPTTVRSPQNEARIDASRRPAPVLSLPPSVRRSCARSASTAPGSNHASAPVDRHGPAPRRALRHRPQIALHSPPLEPPSIPVPRSGKKIGLSTILRPFRYTNTRCRIL
jgi:hypothetical protein